MQRIALQGADCSCPVCVAQEGWLHCAPVLALQQNLGLERQAAFSFCYTWFDEVPRIFAFSPVMHPCCLQHHSIEHITAAELDMLDIQVSGRDPERLLCDCAALCGAACVTTGSRMQQLTARVDCCCRRCRRCRRRGWRRTRTPGAPTSGAASLCMKFSTRGALCAADAYTASDVQCAEVHNANLRAQGMVRAPFASDVVQWSCVCVRERERERESETDLWAH
jgi:hypothetical protein